MNRSYSALPCLRPSRIVSRDIGGDTVAQIVAAIRLAMVGEDKIGSRDLMNPSWGGSPARMTLSHSHHAW